jgi:hypothetical protein
MAIPNSAIRWLMGLIFLPAFLLQGCATSTDVRSARMDQRFRAAATILERQTEADSLAAAALLRSSEGKSERAVDLMTSAMTAAPERADLVWLTIQLCQRVSSCDSEPKEAWLRSLDASNGAGWLKELLRASASKDEAAIGAALTALSHTEHFDVYWTVLIAHLTPPIAATREVPLREAIVDVIGILAAQALPIYQVVSKLCKDDGLSDADVIADCRGIALTFERGDTYITEMVGVTIAKRVWPADSAEWREATEAKRIYQYRSALSLRSAAHMDARWASRYLALCGQNRREQDVELALVIDEGKNPNPPADWIPQ